MPNVALRTGDGDVVAEIEIPETPKPVWIINYEGKTYARVSVGEYGETTPYTVPAAAPPAPGTLHDILPPATTTSAT